MYTDSIVKIFHTMMFSGLSIHRTVMSVSRSSGCLRKGRFVVNHSSELCKAARRPMLLPGCNKSDSAIYQTSVSRIG